MDSRPAKRARVDDDVDDAQISLRTRDAGILEQIEDIEEEDEVEDLVAEPHKPSDLYLDTVRLLFSVLQPSFHRLIKSFGPD